jgi:hypothetical protein
MLQALGGGKVGAVTVATTHNTGLSPEYWAERATSRIVAVSAGASLQVQQQAEAFKQQVYNSVLLYMKHAINSDRSTLAGEMAKQGHNDMAEIIRRL